MRLLFLDNLDAEPGLLLEWSAVAGSEPRPTATPPTSNQSIHLANRGPTTWLGAYFEVPGAIDATALGAAFGAWIPRHDALHCCFGPADAQTPVSLRLVADTDIRLTARAPIPVSDAERLRALLAARLDRACSPSRFPPYFLGAVSRRETSSVVVGFDHAICDAWSIAIAVTELDALYRAARRRGHDGVAALARRLPEPGSFLSYAAGEAALPSAATEPLLRGWRDFLYAAGADLPRCRDTPNHGDMPKYGDLPRFPIDLGLTERAPFGGDVRPLLGPVATDALHRGARANGHSLFAALLAPVALAAAESGGRTMTDLVFPVHTRREPLHHNTFGWLVANAPARIPALRDFTTTALAAEAAIRAGRRLARVPASRVIAAMGPSLRRTRRDLFTVSYVDYRRLPGGTSRTGPRNAAQFSRGAPADDVQLWFTRTEEGLALRTRFPATPSGRKIVGEFLDQVAETITAAVPPG